MLHSKAPRRTVSEADVFCSQFAKYDNQLDLTALDNEERRTDFNWRVHLMHVKSGKK